MVVEAENKRLWAHNVNKFIAVILRITDVYSTNKKGTINVNIDKPLSAERGVCEPIRSSLTLHYVLSVIKS